MKRYSGKAAVFCAFFSLTSLVMGADDYYPQPDSQGGWRNLKDASAIRKTGGMNLTREAQFSHHPIGTDDGLRRMIEMVVAAVVQ